MDAQFYVAAWFDGFCDCAAKQYLPVGLRGRLENCGELAGQVAGNERLLAVEKELLCRVQRFVKQLGGFLVVDARH